MSLYKRFGIIIACTFIYWCASTVIPELTAPVTLKALSALFAFILTLEVFVFRQLNVTTGAGVLKSSELERLNIKRAEIRRKIYGTGVLVVASMATLFIIGLVATDPSNYPWLAFAVGLLVGVGLNYIAVIINWINQLSAFADHLRHLEQQQKDFSEQLKRLTEAAKAK